MIKHTKIRWKTHEVATLVTMWKAGKPISAIAARLGREEKVVRSKASNLRKQEPKTAKLLKSRMVYKNYVLTPEMVRKIRLDKRSLGKIGGDYSVSAVTIWKIQNRQMWKGVK